MIEPHEKTRIAKTIIGPFFTVIGITMLCIGINTILDGRMRLGGRVKQEDAGKERWIDSANEPGKFWALTLGICAISTGVAAMGAFFGYKYIVIPIKSSANDRGLTKR